MSPAKILARTSGRTFHASWRFASYGPPDHIELSLSTTRWLSTPPMSIAPSRPLPIGQDSRKDLPGVSNQTWVLLADGWAPQVAAASIGKTRARVIFMNESQPAGDERILSIAPRHALNG